ncbi:MAG TPA: ATP-binding protein, partial [Thermoleophilia bacterium]|nr:ATP-binding protein [Thermoleophilia bacterium]
RNPYTPNAGARPPLLVGRDDQLTAFDVLLARLGNGYAEQSMIVTGLRGVGKTVLLNEFRARADEAGWVAIEAEITRQTDFPVRMAQLGRRALLHIAPKARWKDRALRAAGILKSFTLTVTSDGALTAALDVDPVEGQADSGQLVEDLSDLLVGLGEAARDHDTGVVLLLDEIQFLSGDELEALIVALHRTVQRALPVTMVGAGLPQVARLAGEAKSYAERLFTFPDLGSLAADAALEALVGPADALGVEFEPAAADAVLEYTQGYPFFLQEYGKILWDEAEATPVTAAATLAVRPLVDARLDASFFRVRVERTSRAELRYLRAMAELGPGPQNAGDVARLLDKASAQVAPIRARLIEKGLLYTPGYGLAAFTVPQFERFLLRAYPAGEGGPQA